jgi:lipid-A-disaccharide synthase
MRVPSAVLVFLRILRHCRTHRPDVVVLIANDVFNVVLGRQLRARGIRTVAFFPPQTWIWEAVLRVIAPSLDLVLASFPDEARCYNEAGVATEFVGHYLADVLSPITPADRTTARRALGLDADTPVVAILPGSRSEEVARHLSVLLATADVLYRNRPVRIVAVYRPADTTTTELGTPGGNTVQLVDDSHAAMRAADVALVCSGTATLEASLLGVPLVVAYRTSWLTYRIVRAAIRVGLLRGETVAIPNLLLHRTVVPEFVQNRLTPSALAAQLLTLMDDEQPRRTMLEELREVRAQVARPGTMALAAQAVLERGGVPT